MLLQVQLCLSSPDLPAEPLLDRLGCSYVVVVASDGNGIGECACTTHTYMADNMKVHSDQEKLSLFTLPSSIVP